MSFAKSLCIALLTVLTLPNVSISEEPPAEISFGFKPYLWGVGVDGDVGKQNVQLPNGGTTDLIIPVDFTAGDILEAALDDTGDGEIEALLSGGLMISPEIQAGRWGLLLDLGWIRVDANSPTEGPFLSLIDVRLEQIVADAALSYRVYESETSYLDVLAGARYFSLSTDFDLTPNFAEVESISHRVVDRSVALIRNEVQQRVAREADAISEHLASLATDLAEEAGEAVGSVKARIRDGVSDRLAEELGSRIPDQIDLGPAEQRLANAIKNAIAERVGQLVEEKKTELEMNKEAIKDELVSTAGERLDDLKKNVSAKGRRAIEKAEHALQDEIQSAMEKTAEAEVRLEQDWVDPYIGFRTRKTLSQQVFVTANGDVGGFGVSSDLLWQIEVAMGWQINETISLEGGWRHMMWDYNRGDVVLDAEYSGVMLTCGIRL